MRRRGSRVIETLGDVSVTGYVQSIRPFNPTATRWNITVGVPASSRAATVIRESPEPLAPHVPVHGRRCLRSPHDVEGNGLMRVAAEAFHFGLAIPGIERVADRKAI